MHIARLQNTDFDDENSLCCGGSLGNMKISFQKKNKIARDAAAELTKGNPDMVATACPLCKKTFAAATAKRVADIAEIVAEAIAIPQKVKNQPETVSVKKVPADIYN